MEFVKRLFRVLSEVTKVQGLRIVWRLTLEASLLLSLLLLFLSHLLVTIVDVGLIVIVDAHRLEGNL